MKPKNMTGRLQVLSFMVFLLPFIALYAWSNLRPFTLILGFILLLATPIISLTLSFHLRKHQTSRFKGYGFLYFFCAGNTCLIYAAIFSTFLPSRFPDWNENTHAALAYCVGLSLAFLLTWVHINAINHSPTASASETIDTTIATQQDAPTAVNLPSPLSQPQNPEPVVWPSMPAWFMSYDVYHQSKPEPEYITQLDSLFDEICYFHNTAPARLDSLLEMISPSIYEPLPNADTFSLKVHDLLLYIASKVPFKLPSIPFRNLDANATLKEIQETWALYDSNLEWYLLRLSEMIKPLHALYDLCCTFHDISLSNWSLRITDMSYSFYTDALDLADHVKQLQGKFPYRYKEDGADLSDKTGCLPYAYPQPNAAWAYLFHVPGSTPPSEAPNQPAPPASEPSTGAKAHAEFTRRKILRMMGFPENPDVFASERWFSCAKLWACGPNGKNQHNAFLFEPDGLSDHLLEQLGSSYQNQQIYAIHQIVVIDDEPYRDYWHEGQIECFALTTLPPYPVLYDIAFAITPGRSIREFYLNYQNMPTDSLGRVLNKVLQLIDPPDPFAGETDSSANISIIVSIVSEQLCLTHDEYDWDATYKMYERLTGILKDAFQSM